MLYALRAVGVSDEKVDVGNIDDVGDAVYASYFYWCAFRYSCGREGEAMFKKWRAMLTRDAKSSSCVAALDEHCLSKDVLGFISQARCLRGAQKLKKVNAFVNRVRYHSYNSLYGTNDYWASSGEFFSRGKGGCEDFGIAKYALLMA